jgi:hypothetical protein
MTALAVLPSSVEAFGRRNRCQPAQPCCQGPVVYYPACGLPGGYYPAPGQPLLWSGQPPLAAATTVAIKGKTYRIVPHPDRGDEREDERDLAAEVLPKGAAGSSIPAADRFMGTARRQPKTTIFNGPGEPESFDTVTALLDSLPANDVMKGTIASAPDAKRVEKEKRNVRVKAYIYAFKKEDDNDYHVILGDAPGTANVRYLNAEVSGIPIAGTDENRDRLWAVRNAFKSAFMLGVSGPGSYYRPNPPVPVRVTGSLFWDVDHENPPYVGPADFKPKTAWEIHPISDLEFMDE